MARLSAAPPAWYAHDHGPEERECHQCKDNEFHAQIPFPVNPSCTECLVCSLRVSVGDVQSQKSRPVVAYVRKAHGAHWCRELEFSRVVPLDCGLSTPASSFAREGTLQPFPERLTMFSVQDRERVKAFLLEQARADARVVSAAAVGSSAGDGDRWSDLDLTFGVAEGTRVQEVLSDWTETLRTTFDSVVLFDLPALSTIYRVFLLPGKLQVDLSFTPAAEFGATGPRFTLLFGEAVERPPFQPAPASYTFGLAVHHLVRAHICIERGRVWQAEYWIHGVRDLALSLACLRLGLESSHGRGFDRLPPEVLEPLAGALVAIPTVDELRRALAVATTGLLAEAGALPVQERGWIRRELGEFLHPSAV
jgi:hypothetical protein